MKNFTSLYFHFPFCETKCHYCDFYSIGREKTRDGDASTFEKALIQEIKIRGDQGAFAPELSTVFLGGGTPSMTPPDSMERIFRTLFQYTRITEKTEWTMEANPSSISYDTMKAYREIGLNRVSMGVQSLQDSHLKLLGRVHDSSAAFVALDQLFKAGFTNVSTDLLCGVPGQTTDDLRDHIQRLTEFPITHLSIYLLTLAKHHSMFSQLPSDDEQLRHLLYIDEAMTSRGFDHYEISNFAKSSTTLNFQAQHNLVYWKDQPYLGLGPSAHSFAHQSENLLESTAPQRFKNFSSLHAWANSLAENKLPVEWTESLSPDQRELEKWMLAIRLAEGFPADWIDTDRRRAKLAAFQKEGLLIEHPERRGFIKATARGFALSDALTRELA